MTSLRRRGVASIAAVAAPALFAVLIVASGCSKSVARPEPPSIQGPIPSSPENLIRLFEWCWNRRDTTRYAEVFADDYRFMFAPLDSAGVSYRDQPWSREDELIAFRNLVRGSASISLRLDRNLYPGHDPRPGKAWPWHQLIRTSVALSIMTTDGAQMNVTGFARFFVTRGDSAPIPSELVARGFGPDSTRWYVDRWEDETMPSALGPGFRAQPTRNMTWGSIKALYRRFAPAIVQRSHE